MKFRAALIGLGGIAWKYDAQGSATFSLSQAGAFLGHPDVELLGGCSPNPSDRHGFSTWSSLPVWESEVQMLKDLRPEIVGICSPSGLHCDHFRACCNAGVQAVWLEKPPSLSLEHTLDMMSLAVGHGMVVGVNYFRRYLPAYQRLRQALQSGRLGSVYSYHIHYSPGMARNGCHLLDQLFFLADTDDFEVLWKDTETSATSPSCVLKIPTGQTVFICGGDLAYHSNSITVVCDDGTAAILQGGSITRFDERIPNKEFRGFYTLAPQQECFMGNGGLDHYMENSLNALLEAYRNGKPLLSTLETAFATQRLMAELLGKDAS